MSFAHAVSTTLHARQCFFETPSKRPLTTTDECKHGVNVVENTSSMWSPRVGEFYPAVSGFSALQLNAPKERRGVDQVCNFRRTGGANPAVVQGECAVTIPQRKVEQSQMPPAVCGDHRIRLPLVLCSLNQRTPASGRSVISKMCAITWCARALAPSRASAASAVRSARWNSPASSSPKACIASTAE